MFKQWCVIGFCTLTACSPQIISLSGGSKPEPPSTVFSYSVSDSLYMINSPANPIIPNGQAAQAAYSVSPGLPSGFSLDSSTGIISGTPTVDTARMEYTVTAQNAGGTGTASFFLKTAGTVDWAWVTGSTSGNQAGNYGTLGLVSSSNYPGSRIWPVTWTDSNGNFWLFSGAGYDSAGTNDLLNDVWKYDGSKWTWITGSHLVDASGVFGTLGVAAPAHQPGARTNSVSWYDSSHSLWVLGGSGYDSVGAQGELNDLWKFDGNNWAWMGGANVKDQLGVYGSQGTPSPSNWPGGRETHNAWLDKSGNAWIFAGWGCASGGCNVWLNDLWKYDGTNWTWIKGSKTGSANGVYGTQGTAAAGNSPGGRNYAASWTDLQGNLWVFGGNGLDSAGTGNLLNDLWKFDGTNWTWVKGSNLAQAAGIWGALGAPSTANTPSARRSALAWTDRYGNLWLFGGYGYDSAATIGALNDLWKFDGTNWTWISGTHLANQVPDYSAQNILGPTPPAGGRRKPGGWIDASGDLWLFGGYGIDSTNTGSKYLNDLWKFRY